MSLLRDSLSLPLPWVTTASLCPSASSFKASQTGNRRRKGEEENKINLFWKSIFPSLPVCLCYDLSFCSVRFWLLADTELLEWREERRIAGWTSFRKVYLKDEKQSKKKRWTYQFRGSLALQAWRSEQRKRKEFTTSTKNFPFPLQGSVPNYVHWYQCFGVD